MHSNAVARASVFIRSNGVAILEYDDDADTATPNTTICYVEAVPNTPFTIDLELTPDFPHNEHELSFRASVDGKHVDKQALSLRSVPKRGLKASITGRIEWERDQFVRRQIQFASHSISESG